MDNQNSLALPSVKQIQIPTELSKYIGGTNNVIAWKTFVKIISTKGKEEFGNIYQTFKGNKMVSKRIEYNDEIIEIINKLKEENQEKDTVIIRYYLIALKQQLIFI